MSDMANATAKVDVQKIYETNGWPYPIDFASLPERIIARSKQLSHYLISPEDVRAHPIFKSLQADVEEIGLSLSRLNTMSAPVALYDKSIPG